MVRWRSVEYLGEELRLHPLTRGSVGRLLARNRKHRACSAVEYQLFRMQGSSFGLNDFFELGRFLQFRVSI
jgi:hypothetical protein